LVYGRAAQISCRGGSGHPESEQTNRPHHNTPSRRLVCDAELC